MLGKRKVESVGVKGAMFHTRPVREVCLSERGVPHRSPGPGE